MIREADDELDALTTNGEELARPMQRAVRNIMWNHCGVVRNGPSMEEGLEKIADLRQAAQHVDVRPSAEGFVDLALALDLLGAIDSAEATIRGALHRCESRGSHQRLDFEETMPEQRVNYLVELDSQGGQQVSRHPVEPVPAYLAERFEEFTEPEVEGRLLE